MTVRMCQGKILIVSVHLNLEPVRDISPGRFRPKEHMEVACMAEGPI